MILISDNLIGLIELPKEAVVRVNLAWNLPSNLESHISNIKNDIMLDLPRLRSKPPHTTHELEDIKYLQIKYLAISNVSTVDDLVFIEGVDTVPKIETMLGVENLSDIIDALNNKIVMLDHDDLWRDCKTLEVYSECMKTVENVCKEKGAELLTTRGVVFQSKL